VDELAERGRHLVAAAVADTYAPLALRERIEAERERARRPARRRSFAFAGSIAAAAAAAIVAIVIALNGGAASPSVLATVQLAGGGPTLPAPHRDARNPKILTARLQGVPFPEWGPQFKWRAAGERRDEIAGRPTTTVYYDNPAGARAAYTILGGKAIAPPEGARSVRFGGTELYVMRRGRSRIVTWNRAGHTCVMIAPAAVPENKLIRLAAWDGGGSVPF